MRIHWNCDDEAHYTFIALGNFRAILQNKGIRSKLEVWLTFLSADDPEWIEKLLMQHPEFRVMYNDVYEICRNLEEVMHMYSKELRELDEGTIPYMMDDYFPLMPPLRGKLEGRMQVCH